MTNEERRAKFLKDFPTLESLGQGNANAVRHQAKKDLRSGKHAENKYHRNEQLKKIKKNDKNKD
jgi:hypothetical protein